MTETTAPWWKALMERWEFHEPWAPADGGFGRWMKAGRLHDIRNGAQRTSPLFQPRRCTDRPAQGAR
jgi:hypothetical protein